MHQKYPAHNMKGWEKKEGRGKGTIIIKITWVKTTDGRDIDNHDQTKQRSRGYCTKQNKTKRHNVTEWTNNKSKKGRDEYTHIIYLETTRHNITVNNHKQTTMTKAQTGMHKTNCPHSNGCTKLHKNVSLIPQSQRM